MIKQEERQVALQVANYLLDINAVQFRFEAPVFKWSSGWNSPIYCDIRQTLSYPIIRNYLKNYLVELIQEQFPNTNYIAGVATAGIPQGVLVADALQLPFVYVRAKPKEHGKENLVEGLLIDKAQIVVVEDVISTGKSTLQAVEALQQLNPHCKVLGALSIFHYGFDTATQAFAQANVPVQTLCSYSSLLIEVQKKHGLSEETMASLHEWRQKPEQWQL